MNPTTMTPFAELLIEGSSSPSYDILMENPNSSMISNITVTRPYWHVVLDTTATGIMTVNTVSLMLGMGAATYWKDVSISKID